jgi:hypothetical protein
MPCFETSFLRYCNFTGCIHFQHLRNIVCEASSFIYAKHTRSVKYISVIFIPWTICILNEGCWSIIIQSVPLKRNSKTVTPSCIKMKSACNTLQISTATFKSKSRCSLGHCSHQLCTSCVYDNIMYSWLELVQSRTVLRIEIVCYCPWSTWQCLSWQISID